MAYLHGAPCPTGCELDYWGLEGDCDTFRAGRPSAEELWAEYGAGIAQDWAERFPGHRPPLWWTLTCLEPLGLHPRRLRLGGTGRPLHEWLAYAPLYSLGVPSLWEWAKDGQPADANHASRADPPTFETEASCLTRLRLLLPGEARRIPATALAPVAIRRW
jgi:hypothetical protein